MTETEQRILAYLRENPGATSKDMADKFGMTVDYVAKHCHGLELAGELRRVVDRSRVYAGHGDRLFIAEAAEA